MQQVENTFDMDSLDIQLQLAINASRQDALEKEREQMDLDSIISLSMHEHARNQAVVSEIERVEQLMVDEVVALSFENEAFAQVLAPSEQAKKVHYNTMIDVSSYSPEEIAHLKKARLILQNRLGVDLWVKPGNQLSISSYDEDAMNIAIAEIQSMVSDPYKVKIEVDNLDQQSLYVFVDNSNLFLGSQNIDNPAYRKEDDMGSGSGPGSGSSSALAAPGNTNAISKTIRDPRIRVKIDKLRAILAAGRHCEERQVFGSSPKQKNAPVWRQWKEQGYKLHIQERGHAHARESFVDDAIIAQMLLSIMKYRSSSLPLNLHGKIRTLVLVSGDGNANSGRASFPVAILQALQVGWNVEVWAWKNSTNDIYKQLIHLYSGSGQFKLFYLDNYRDKITYTIDVSGGGGGAAGRGSGGRGRGGRVASSIGSTSAAPQEEEEEEAVAAADPDDIFFCPLTFDVIQDPVRIENDPTKCIYERSEITRWVEHHHRCPMTNIPRRVEDIVAVTEVDYLVKLAAFRNNGNTV